MTTKKNGKTNAKADKKAAKPGVISSILECIQKGESTIDDIADYVMKVRPDRKRDSVMNTIKIQIGSKKRPLRMEKEKKVKIKARTEGDKVFFSV